jgi:hypothetical protein
VQVQDVGTLGEETADGDIKSSLKRHVAPFSERTAEILGICSMVEGWIKFLGSMSSDIVVNPLRHEPCVWASDLVRSHALDVGVREDAQRAELRADA